MSTYDVENDDKVIDADTKAEYLRDYYTCTVQTAWDSATEDLADLLCSKPHSRLGPQGIVGVIFSDVRAQASIISRGLGYASTDELLGRVKRRLTA